MGRYSDPVLGHHGFFIALEGPDGVGKSTQVRLLAKEVVGYGREVILTREPGGTPLGESLRELLLGKTDIDTWSEALLMAAARAEHLSGVILPAMAEGKVVICDRFVGSSLAYQGYGRGLGWERVLELYMMTPGAILPDLTILLDAPSPLVAASMSQADRFEAEGHEFWQRVREGFLSLATEMMWEVVDGRSAVPAVSRRLREIVGPRLGSF